MTFEKPNPLSVKEIREAVDGDQMVPYFQPIVELRSGQVIAFEVLARWRRPDGAVLPSDFISLAENNGLIGAVTEQVFSKAFRLASLLPPQISLSVNVSPVQLPSPTFAGELRRLAEAHGFPLERVIVEVTETALLKEADRVKSTAYDLKSMGCKLALDDFGTGYSSLRHLQMLPFDELKIDLGFVREIARKREDRKIVAAIIGLGHSLGLATVAEGIETEEQSHLLLWLGCELGQGWRYNRPVPASQIPGILSAKPVGLISGLTAPGDDWAPASLDALPTLRLAQLQAIYDGAPVGLCFLDRNMRYVSLNKRLAGINGLPISAHLGRTVKEVLPNVFPIFEPFLKRALGGESITGVEFYRPSGIDGQEPLKFLASYQPAWDESDEVIGVSISLLDISELKPFVDPSASIAKTNPEAPWVMDAEGNDLQTSSRWVQTSPLGKNRTRNLRWLEAVHGDDLERVVLNMAESLRTGRPIDIEYRILDVNDNWRWMRSTGLPRYNASGEITRWYGSVEDIHERKQLESATSSR